MSLSNKLLYEINSLVKSKSIDVDDIVYSKEIKKYTLSNYIDFDWKNILQKPSRNSSEYTIDDLLYVCSLTLNRTAKDIDLIKQVDKDPSILVKNLCDSVNINFPQDLFDKYYDHTKNLIYVIKQYFNRPRPQQLADFYNLKIDVITTDTHHTASYPSGHTVYAKLAALLVSEKYPKLKPILDHSATIVAYARCSQGVHFPSDNKASIILANFIYQHLKSKLEV